MIPTQGNVLLLDYETCPEEQNERIKAIRNGLGVSSGDIYYRYCEQPLPYDITEIQRIVLENDIKLIAIDSVVAAAGADPDKAEVATQYFNALRSLKITSLSVDHTAKSPESKGPFGSVFKYNRARSVFELRKSQEPGENTIELGLYHRKVNSGRLLPPSGYRITFSTNEFGIMETVTFSKIDVRQVPELAGALPIKDRIAGLLVRGPMTTAELAETMDTGESTIRAILNRHKNIFTKVKNKWGLLTSEE
jgi:hypothetical protein